MGLNPQPLNSFPWEILKETKNVYLVRLIQQKGSSTIIQRTN